MPPFLLVSSMARYLHNFTKIAVKDTMKTYFIIK
jgi:hypothetical protein